MRRRWVKVLVITAAVLAVLFTAADRIAVHYAEKEAARLVETRYGGSGSGTGGSMDVAIDGFPFLTQAVDGTFGHVSMSANKYYLSTTANRQNGNLDVDRLQLDLYDVTVTSLTARSAEANRASGTLVLSYRDLSDLLTRLAGNGGRLQASAAPGSDGQAARIKVAGTVGGTALNTTGTVLAQGDELTLTVPGAERATENWRVSLPENVGFTEARATKDGVEIGLVGHLVPLGASRFSR
ncbi:DUF2993 domain-containing protein [Streptomyces sp. NPDC059095]|uniref:LmeA family phospholipid-binding protein n=1 Tax=Streptomyces sp. NPDC059095 TaxID=3346726 RepID=UPI0036AE9C15